ncbi:MAG: hypothetical protein H7Y37_17495 [Anaerolineae bacterium]|nr:hypothetical protein [Gloeobacterales cyanobacterium ES-bin-313]
MESPTSEILVQDIDHLGIVAGIIHQIGPLEEVEYPPIKGEYRQNPNPKYKFQESQLNLRKVGFKLLAILNFHKKSGLIDMVFVVFKLILQPTNVPV